MPSIDLRDVVPYAAGANSSFTTINGTPFNTTALIQYEYKLYSNNTISNATQCYLVFGAFRPTFLANGTWLDATTCYIPFYPIAARGILSIVFGLLFALTLVLALINLRKHGKRYLRDGKRFTAVGRRWPWYWMLFVAACGMISTFTGVDIDRYYLQDLPIILQSLFFALMVPGTLAMVWEGTRHWSSWQQRQIHDTDPLLVPQHDNRANTEFWLPLVFYSFAFLDFFLVIPRSWTGIKKQNTEWQIKNIAQPAVTGPRNKAGPVFAFCAWLVICYSLWHSMKHYKQGSWRQCPPKLATNIILLAIRLGYGIASAWNWDISISRVDVQVGWPFGIGYAPILLITFVFNIAGFHEENEDKMLVQQRTARGRVYDAGLNISRKPTWWQNNIHNRYLSDEQRLKQMTTEIEGGRVTTQGAEEDFEMRNLTADDRSINKSSRLSFQDESDSTHSPGDSEIGEAERLPQQKIWSMLDV